MIVTPAPAGQPSGDSTAGAAGDVPEEGGQPSRQGVLGLTLGAVGIVFGDIGTSPIYAFRETFVGHHLLTPDRAHIYGVLSLIFWSLMIVVTVKYVAIIMRADNKGEGGSLALLALINRQSPGRRWSAPIILLGVFATALFYGDSMIAPAMSVLSATEGLTVVSPGFAPLVLPIAVTILIALFFFQAIGTARVGALFGPIMIVYFTVLAVLGIIHVARMPGIVAALDPRHAIAFFRLDGARAFLALGSVVLAVTGAEALYANMGHFGRNPIRYSWLILVLPALMLNYLGQGAMILGDPAHAAEVIRNPFFYLPPESLRLPLVILSILATIIASQAVIAGTFALTQQAIQLGFIPRLRVLHTSENAVGQIYIPAVNWALMTMVLLLVLFFRSSSNLAAAYGIAVTGAMFIDSLLLGVVLTVLWKWNRALALPLLGVFLCVDTAYLLSNLTKVRAGGWVPLLVGIVIFIFLTTWAKGRQLMIDRLGEAAMPVKVFIRSAATSASRVPGTAVFMTSVAEGVPHALLHNLKHNKVLHERIILLTVAIADQPYWPETRRAKLEDMGHGFHRCVLKFGFMEEADVPAALKQVSACSGAFSMMDTSFFLSRQTLIASERPGMMIWREQLFAWMLRNAESAMEFFRLPTNRVVELGSQVEI